MCGINAVALRSRWRPLRYDVLRPQRLAAPVTVYVEQFSAHPLEADAVELYGPADGYLRIDGTFSRERTAPDDRTVYEVELLPDDGYYPLPYMAVQADGSAWEEECAQPFAAEARARQPFLPDGSRSFEEIDRLGIGSHGLGNLIGARADVDFYRIEPRQIVSDNSSPASPGLLLRAAGEPHLCRHGVATTERLYQGAAGGTAHRHG